VNKRQIDLSVTLRAWRLLQSWPLVRSPAQGRGSVLTPVCVLLEEHDKTVRPG